MILFWWQSEELLMEKLRKWKTGMEAKGLRVNAGKTKVMQCRVSRFQSEDSGEHPCGACRKAALVIIQSYAWSALQWVHKRCSGISGKLKSNADLSSQEMSGGWEYFHETVWWKMLTRGILLSFQENNYFHSRIESLRLWSLLSGGLHTWFLLEKSISPILHISKEFHGILYK